MSAAVLKSASVRAGEALILDRVDLAARPGELTALVGPNGAGKSTALKAMLGLVALAGGAAELGGEPLDRLAPRKRGRLAAYLPQERPLVWRLAVEDVVALGLFAWNGRSYRRLDPAGQAKVRATLERLDIAGLFGRDLTTLSGGERARVHLARALISPAPALIVDEPANALDLKHQHQAMAVLREEAEAGRAVLAALHDLDAARRWADRIVVLDAGRVVADAPSEEALSPDRLADVFGVKRAEDGGYAPV